MDWLLPYNLYPSWEHFIKAKIVDFISISVAYTADEVQYRWLEGELLIFDDPLIECNLQQ